MSQGIASGSWLMTKSWHYPFLNSLGSDRRRSIRFLMWFGRQVHIFTGPTLTLIFLWIQSVTPIITPLRRKSDLMF